MYLKRTGGINFNEICSQIKYEANPKTRFNKALNVREMPINEGVGSKLNCTNITNITIITLLLTQYTKYIFQSTSISKDEKENHRFFFQSKWKYTFSKRQG